MKQYKVKAVCFDMWGTLTEGGGQNQWDELQEILGATHVDKKTFLKLGEENLLMHPWTLREGIKHLAKSLNLKLENAAIEKAYICWWGYVQSSKPYPEVDEVLDRLERYNMRKFIISNTDVEAFNFKIKKLGWEEYFEKIFLSAEIGVLKPHVKIFATVQNYLRLPKGQILLIDDSLHHGVYPARRFGWQTLWVARGEEGKDQGRTENLKGVIDYINK